MIQFFMAKLDEVKEFIGFLKAVFLALVAIDSSLVAWLFSHTIISIKSIIVLFLVLIITINIVILFKSILNKIKMLKDL